MPSTLTPVTASSIRLEKEATFCQAIPIRWRGRRASPHHSPEQFIQYTPFILIAIGGTSKSGANKGYSLSARSEDSDGRRNAKCQRLAPRSIASILCLHRMEDHHGSASDRDKGQLPSHLRFQSQSWP